MWIDITDKQKDEFNRLATHPLQSYEWGEFREKTGLTVIRKGFFVKNTVEQAFQLTVHPIPHTPWNIGYIPKGTLPSKEMIEELYRVGKKNNCVFIQIEPDVTKSHDLNLNDWKLEIRNRRLQEAAHPLFTKYTLMLDLIQSEEQLLAHMHPKARYNIKIAQKHNVTVKEENTKEGFETFWKLTEETTNRQRFFAHTKKYHVAQWETLPHKITQNTLSSHLLVARYNNVPLTAWIVFVFHNALYYPYGASSSAHRETMHSTKMMWEAIQFGKRNKLKNFDLWGSTPPNTPSSDPWFGFTQFKERFGPQRVEFLGSYDLVINSVLYKGYKIADKLRWLLLRPLK